MAKAIATWPSESCIINKKKKNRRFLRVRHARLKRDVFEPRTETGIEHFACQGSRLSQTFQLIVCTSEKLIHDLNVVVTRQEKTS